MALDSCHPLESSSIPAALKIQEPTNHQRSRTRIPRLQPYKNSLLLPISQYTFCPAPWGIPNNKFESIAKDCNKHFLSYTMLKPILFTLTVPFATPRGLQCKVCFFARLDRHPFTCHIIENSCSKKSPFLDFFFFFLLSLLASSLHFFDCLSSTEQLVSTSL